LIQLSETHKKEKSDTDVRLVEEQRAITSHDERMDKLNFYIKHVEKALDDHKEMNLERYTNMSDKIENTK